ncbi:MAG: DUF192 domain-containing protein [Chloroflexi bacterium]|nr:DUF192 domain-containing protein [Chloroflexota bacterium]
MLTRRSVPSAAALLAVLVAGVVALGLIAFTASGRARAQSGVGSCGDPSAPYAEVQIATHPRINLQLARTEQERETGLMYVDNLPPDGGMLFVYTAPSNESYWMYHTLIPLSIAWIDRDGTIVDIQDMPRLNDPNDIQEASNTIYTPSGSYWYALEVNEGWFAQNGVGVGQQMLFCLGGS